MEMTRAISISLAMKGDIEILQKRQRIDPTCDLKGPIRLRIAVDSE